MELLFAALVFGLCILGSVCTMSYFLYKTAGLLTKTIDTIAVLKAAPDARSAKNLLKQMQEEGKVEEVVPPAPLPMSPDELGRKHWHISVNNCKYGRRDTSH